MSHGGIANNRSVNRHPHPDLSEAVQISRFWRLVERNENSECWPWLGDTDRNNYGVFFFQGKRYGAHELAYSFTFGEKRASGLDTRHACDNPICCNPLHLSFGTRAENVRDMLSRGRSRNWNRVSNKLSEKEVMEIRTRRANGAPQKVLARQYGVSPTYISEIVRGLVWAHVPGPIQGKNEMYRKVV